MRYDLKIVGANTGRLKSGYTVQIFAYSTGSSGYSGSALYTLSDNGDGTYYTEITTTIKGTVVITTPTNGTTVVPTNKIGIILQGNNQPTIMPGSSTP